MHTASDIEETRELRRLPIVGRRFFLLLHSGGLMAVKPMPWFRLYTEFAHDPKVQSMSEAMQRRLVMLYCLYRSGELEKCNENETAFALHVTIDELKETLKLFKSKNFTDENGIPTHWEKRQFDSDSSLLRVRKHRAKKKQQ